MFQLLIRKLNAKIFLLFVTLIGLFFNLNHGQVNAAPDTALIITGVFDGPITGGIPKFVEFYVAEDIANLSLYGFGSANNGGGTDGQEFTFPAVAATSGNFIYVATESTQFTNYFGFAPTYINGTAPSINGDDAVELFYNGTVIDVFGDINLSGTGQAWDYLDGWAYRNDATGPDSSTFVIGSWSFSTPNATDGCTTNAACASVFPIGTYSPSGGDTPPQVSSTTPADAATDIATNTNISVDFNESVTTTAGWYNVSCSTSGDVTSDYSNTPTTATSHSLTYTGTGLADSETCTVTLNAANISDSGGNQLDGDNDFSFTIAAAVANILINEIHADPSTTVGDANGDGTADFGQDEFVEIYNNSGAALDISGWTLNDAVGVRHTFPASSIIPAQCVIVVFGGGTPTGTFANAVVQTASTGSLGLNNGGDTVRLNDGSSDQALYVYGAEGGSDTSLTRNPDITGLTPLVQHNTVAATPYSAGSRIDGTNFAGCVDAPPQVSSTTPADAAPSVPSHTSISIDFDESVTTTAGWYNVTCTTSGDVTADYSNTPATAASHNLVYTGAGLASGESCTVTLIAANITDSGGNQLDGDGNGTGGDNDSFSFTIGTSYDLIHDIQGTGASVTGAGPFAVEAIVIGDFQASDELEGFFIQEEDAHADFDPLSSEGIFVYCNTCPLDVAVGDLVQITGTASENFGQSQLVATSFASVSIVSSGNPLPSVTSLNITANLVTPLGDKDSFYEPFEGMRVSISDTLTVSEYFELFRFGEIVLYQGGRPYQYTHIENNPTAGGYTTFQTDLARRRIVLDDGSDVQNRPLTISPQQLFYPYPNGFGTGTQGTDFFRGGDTISGLTGILGYGFSEWRLQPSEASYSFTPVNTRPSVPAVTGNITVASFNVLNYFTTIDTTASNNSGTCAPSGTLDCRGADSAAELDNQTDKLVQALAAIDADVFGLLEIQNDNGVTLTYLVNALNAVVGAGTYDFVAAGAIGTDAIQVALIYKTSSVQPFGTFYIDTDAIHDRPPLAQTFEVIDPLNPDYGATFTVVVNHFKSKGSGCGAGDDDTTTGQGNCNGRRTNQAIRLLTWLNGTVIPATGENDVLIIGDLNSYKYEDPIQALLTGGFTDLVEAFGGNTAYSYVFDGQLGYLDHALANASLLPQVVDTQDWHINADEVPVFDYNDDIADVGEASFEEEPDGNPLYEVNPYRTSDHDPVIIGLDLDSNFVPPVAVQVSINGLLGGVINSNNVNTIQVLFDRAVRAAGIADPDSVENPANFVLIAAGANGVIDTAYPVPADFCLNGAVQAGDDIKITLDGVTYNPATYEASVNINTALAPLGQGNYLFVICGSTSIVDDVTLVPLDGNNDGTGGDDFSTAFTVVFPAVGGGTGGGSGSSGGGTVVAGGIDFDGDGIADVSQLPNTGELPLWYNWIVWAGAFLLLTSFALLFFGSRADKKQ